MTQPPPWYPPPPPPQPYSDPYGQPYPPPVPPPTNWWAIASLILGVIGFSLVTVVTSVICGVVGLNRAKHGQGGRGMAIAGMVLSALWVVVGIVVVLVLVANKDAIKDGPLGDLFDPDAVDATAITLGDCISEIPSDASLVSSVKKVACTEQHLGEVYYVATVPGDTFPGEAGIVEYQNKCQPALQAFSPAAMADPEVGMFVLYPTQDSWRRGDRTVTCIATTDVPRTGALERG